MSNKLLAPIKDCLGDKERSIQLQIDANSRTSCSAGDTLLRNLLGFPSLKRTPITAIFASGVWWTRCISKTNSSLRGRLEVKHSTQVSSMFLAEHRKFVGENCNCCEWTISGCYPNEGLDWKPPYLKSRFVLMFIKLEKFLCNVLTIESSSHASYISSRKSIISVAVLLCREVVIVAHVWITTECMLWRMVEMKLLQVVRNFVVSKRACRRKKSHLRASEPVWPS